MWRLQLKLSLSKRHRYLLELLIVSAGMHCIVLLAFCITSKKKERLVLSLSADSAPIVVMPFTKTVGLSAIPHAPAQLNGQKSKASHTQLITAPKPVKKKIVPLVKKEVVQAVAPSPEPKPSEPPKADEVQPRAMPQPESVKKIEEPLAQSSEHQKEAGVAQKAITREPLCVGREDAQLLSLMQEVRQGLEEQWQRPAGLPDGVRYEITIDVDKQGNIRIAKEKSSGALALDIAARSFIVSYNFPKKVWGREIECML